MRDEELQNKFDLASRLWHHHRGLKHDLKKMKKGRQTKEKVIDKTLRELRVGVIKAGNGIVEREDEWDEGEEDEEKEGEGFRFRSTFDLFLSRTARRRSILRNRIPKCDSWWM